MKFKKLSLLLVLLVPGLAYPDCHYSSTCVARSTSCVAKKTEEDGYRKWDIKSARFRPAGHGPHPEWGFVSAEIC